MWKGIAIFVVEETTSHLSADLKNRDESGNRYREGSNFRSNDREHGQNARVYFADSETDNYTDVNDEVNVCNACTLLKNTPNKDSCCKFEPILTPACKMVTGTRMPVKSGLLNDRKITVLRDTGCSGAVVRASLIYPEQLIGDEQTCMLADGTKVTVPIAEIRIESPYFIGNLRAWFMENPAYDIIIGNIEGAREPNDPDNHWQVNAFETRSKAKKTKQA